MHTAAIAGAEGIGVVGGTFHDAATSHREGSSRNIHTAASVCGGCKTAGDAAAGHCKCCLIDRATPAFQGYTAAHACCRAANDVSSCHGKLTAGKNIHTAAVISIAAGKNAAGDSFCTVGFVQHPQTIAACSEFVLCNRVAVLDHQIAALLHPDYAAAVSHSQHKTIQIQRYGAIHRQGIADFNISHQCNLRNAAIRQRRSQCIRCRDFFCSAYGQHRRGQTCQHSSGLRIA